MSQSSAPSTPRFDAVVFDMDGVLVDSEALYIREFEAFSNAPGLDVTQEELLAQVGASHQVFQRMIADVLRRNGIEVAGPEEAERVYEDWARENYVRNYGQIMNPGVPQTLDALREAGVRVALASSAPMRFIHEALGQCGIDDKFELFVSGEQFRESKPNPEIYLHACERLGLEPAHCACVEDSFYGIAAGKAAGMYVIARREERFGFSQDAANVIVDQIPDLLSVVLG